MSRSLIPVLTPHGSLRLDPADDEFSLEDGLAERLETCSRGVLAMACCSSVPGRREAACHQRSYGGAISPTASSLIFVRSEMRRRRAAGNIFPRPQQALSSR